MEWALLLVALALVIGLGAQHGAAREGARPHRSRPATPSPGTEELSAGVPPDDAHDVEQMFAVVDREAAEHLVRLLEVRMRDVIHRQVPVRGIRQSPAPHVARICFSNGVVVLAASRRPGDLMHLAAAMLRTSVTLDRFEVTPDGPALRFGWRHGGVLEVVAVGLDQAD